MTEESITSSYVRRERPDVIVNMVDAANLSRSLFFTTQLLELGIPVVVALNKQDLNEKKGSNIDVPALSKALGCPVVKTVSTTHRGLAQVVEAAVARCGQGQTAPYTQGNVDLTSKAAVGSSSSSTSVARERKMAKNTRCRSPPHSWMSTTWATPSFTWKCTSSPPNPKPYTRWLSR